MSRGHKGVFHICGEEMKFIGHLGKVNISSLVIFDFVLGPFETKTLLNRYFLQVSRCLLSDATSTIHWRSSLGQSGRDQLR